MSADADVDADAPPDRPPTARFLQALNVRRNAIVGFGSGSLFAAVLFVIYVVLPGGTQEAPIFFVGLAFVVAVTVGGMIAILLTIWSAVRLSRSLSDPDDERTDGPASERR